MLHFENTFKSSSRTRKKIIRLNNIPTGVWKISQSITTKILAFEINDFEFSL